ncbi:MAG: hypothetical protein QM809_05895 [Gordonia sp. (in: high G+C Gram-positive bacteria)]|uniref:hypothetical protein n=1 Tax=Gordonia sp. (in: high G+C Gram-positive bacteria) TaxID=84139 RepID=UPI0039E39EE2
MTSPSQHPCRSGPGQYSPGAVRYEMRSGGARSSSRLRGLPGREHLVRALPVALGTLSIGFLLSRTTIPGAILFLVIGIFYAVLLGKGMPLFADGATTLAYARALAGGPDPESGSQSDPVGPAPTDGAPAVCPSGPASGVVPAQASGVAPGPGYGRPRNGPPQSARPQYGPPQPGPAPQPGRAPQPGLQSSGPRSQSPGSPRSGPPQRVPAPRHPASTGFSPGGVPAPVVPPGVGRPQNGPGGRGRPGGPAADRSPASAPASSPIRIPEGTTSKISFGGNDAAATS